jgi:hypothetical protein
MRRLSNDDREIRESRGIWIWRFWPFLLMFVSDLVMSANPSLFQRCIGNPLELAGGGTYQANRLLAAVSLALAIPCGLYRPSADPIYWISLSLFALAIPFAIQQFLWMRRHKAYWDGVRKKEAFKRAEKRAHKRALT